VTESDAQVPQLRPAPQSIDVQFGSPWKVITPSVIRYEDIRWIDEFFQTGRIRLSSFKQFASYPDEHRGDVSEGNAVSLGQSGDNWSAIAHGQGFNSAVLSCSHRLDHKLKAAFGRDSAFEITNTFKFAFEISRQLHGFRLGLEGSCIYRSERTIDRAVDLDLEKYRRPDGTFDMQYLADASNALGGPELLLLKQKRYEDQQEYRLLWELDELNSSYVDVVAPKAVQHCRRVQDEEWT
jgi:hypothetical protein